MLEFSVREYLTEDGRSLFDEWINSLRDLKTRARIRSRLDWVSLGNPGDRSSLGDGVFELRFFFGPGYRVYYGLEGEAGILLLGGGTKESQQNDIQIVRAYWKDYRKRKSGNE